MELLKLLDTSQIIAQAISFLILFFILRVIVWKRFLKVLDDRKEKISSEFKSIEDSKDEVEQLKSDYKARIDNIDEIAKVRLEEAVSEGRRIAEEIRENANAEALQIIEKTDEAIKSELSRAREEFRDDIVDIAITAAGKVIEEKLTESEDKKIVEDFLKRLDRAT
ncbi:MAG: F0F1 ATP synthase subunit B [Candidatus Omnitrophota bacterium]|nr:F0F1 ATP synthase subunit B [Candidatus Omnitrophota bacterium]